MNGHLIILGFCVGGAALAAWLCIRFPTAGPRRFSTVVFSVLAVGVTMSAAGSVFDVLAGFGVYGAAGALLIVVLPALTFAFWIAACALRMLAEIPGLRG